MNIDKVITNTLLIASLVALAMLAKAENAGEYKHYSQSSIAITHQGDVYYYSMTSEKLQKTSSGTLYVAGDKVIMKDTATGNIYVYQIKRNGQKLKAEHGNPMPSWNKAQLNQLKNTHNNDENTVMPWE